MNHDELQDKIRAGLKPKLPKRFYQDVAHLAQNDGNYGITLDSRPVRTPGKALLVLPAEALAAALAGEWQDQGEHINPATMPLTRLANTAIDRIVADNGNALAEIMPFAGADLICYRAPSPAGLQARQQALWSPFLKFAEHRLGAAFRTTETIAHLEQPEAAIHAVADWLHGLDPFRLAAIHLLTSLTGSVLLAYGAQQKMADADAVFAAAHVDEHWEIDQWGEDAEARQRLEGRRQDIAAACRFVDLLDT